MPKVWKKLDKRFRSLLLDEPEPSTLGIVMEMLSVGEHVTMWHISMRHDCKREERGKPWMDFLTKEGFEMPEAVRGHSGKASCRRRRKHASLRRRRGTWASSNISARRTAT